MTYGVILHVRRLYRRSDGPHDDTDGVEGGGGWLGFNDPFGKPGNQFVVADPGIGDIQKGCLQLVVRRFKSIAVSFEKDS